MAKDIKCTCGHSWNKSDSSKKDMYVCHMCGNSNVPKAQVGYKLGKSEDEVRQAVLKKAAEVFAGKKKPYKLPENIEQIEGSDRNVCISGVCGILSDAGFIPNDYYTNTSFAEKASGLGFGSPQTDINILKPGDVFQHLVDANEQGNRYPTHAEIFKGWNDKGEAEFYDYYDFYNWPVSKSSGIRTYDRSELEQRLSRKAKNDQSDTQAQFFSLAGGQNKVTKQFPYNLPENELKDYFEKTHEANTTFSAPAPTIDKNSPLYYSSGEDVRQGTREGLADMFNNKELDKQLKRELKITDQDLQKIKPLIYGVVGQESQFNNPRSTTGGLKYMFENMFNPKGKSLGPGQIKLKSITPSVRESFGITKGSDLQDLKNTYVGLADIISKSANITDKYVSQETHPDLVDKDRFERALYFLNSPGKVRKSDKQNYDKSMKSNSILTNFSEQAMMDAVGRANETKLSMDPGSYPAKVLDRAKELNKTINFEDTSILPEVVVTAKKKKEDGGWLSKFEQGGMVLEQKGDNYGKKPNPNDVTVSTGPGYVGSGYDVQGRDYSPAWGGQFQMGGSLPGAVGFTYARTAGSAPSNGKYAKKTKASAQNGKEMKFYQEGLDFKPNSIAQDGGAIVDPMGQWAHPGEVTIIPSTDITMEGVDYPVLGISDTGDQQMMYPGEDYQFDGDYVTEYPMMKQGGWLSKYQKGGRLSVPTLTDSNPTKGLSISTGVKSGTINPTSKNISQKEAKQIEEKNKLNEYLTNRAEIATAEKPRSLASKTWAILTNPVTAAQYVIAGRGLPEHFDRGPLNPVEHAVNAVNPMSFINAVADTPEAGYNFVKDPSLETAVRLGGDLLQAVPLVRGYVGSANSIGKDLGPIVSQAIKTFKNTSDIPSFGKRLRNAVYSGSAARELPGDMVHHSYFRMTPEEVTAKIASEKAGAPAGAMLGDLNMSINSTPLYFTNATRDASTFTPVRLGNMQHTNFLGWRGKRVEDAIPTEIKQKYSNELLDFKNSQLEWEKKIKNAAPEDRNELIREKLMYEEDNNPIGKMLEYARTSEPDSYEQFVKNYKPEMDRPIERLNTATGLNFPMSRITTDSYGPGFYETPSAVSIKDPNTRIKRILNYTGKNALKAFNEESGLEALSKFNPADIRPANKLKKERINRSNADYDSRVRETEELDLTDEERVDMLNYYLRIRNNQISEINRVGAKRLLERQRAADAPRNYNNGTELKNGGWLTKYK